MSSGINFSKAAVTCVLLALVAPAIFAQQPDEQRIELIGNYVDRGGYLNTLRSGMLIFNDEPTIWQKLMPFYRNFYDRRHRGAVQVIADRPELKYHLWMQDSPSDLVVILPGTGVSHVDLAPTALAQLFHSNNYSALVISSAFNWQFMEAAGSIPTPGFTPVDAGDVRKALSVVLAEVESNHPGMIRRKVLLGSSLGGLHALFSADIERRHGGLSFDRYIAVNPPVDLLHAMDTLDSFHAVGATWRKEDIQQKVRHCVVSYFDILKGVHDTAGPLGAGIQRRRDIRMTSGSLHSSSELSDEDAKFLIGLSFHINLVEMLYCIHKFHDTDYFKTPKAYFDQREIYSELDKFTFMDYTRRILMKELAKGKISVDSLESLGAKAGLAAIEQTLRDNSRVRVLINDDDFFLRAGDRAWFANVLGPRAKIFAHGGHLGNLHTDEVKKAILELASETR